MAEGERAELLKILGDFRCYTAEGQDPKGWIDERIIEWHRRWQPRVTREQVHQIIHDCVLGWCSDSPKPITEAVNKLMALLTPEPEPTWCVHWVYDGRYADQPWRRADEEHEVRVQKKAKFCDRCGTPRPKERGRG